MPLIFFKKWHPDFCFFRYNYSRRTTSDIIKHPIVPLPWLRSTFAVGSLPEANRWGPQKQNTNQLYHWQTRLKTMHWKETKAYDIYIGYLGNRQSRLGTWPCPRWSDHRQWCGQSAHNNINPNDRFGVNETHQRGLLLWGESFFERGYKNSNKPSFGGKLRSG